MLGFVTNAKSIILSLNLKISIVVASKVLVKTVFNHLL